MVYKEVFYRRFGGEVLWYQQLEDWGRAKLPRPLFPLWKQLVDWLHQWAIKQQIKRTMREVDRQAKEIGDAWAKDAEVEMLAAAVDAAQKEHPDAKVEVVRPQMRRPTPDSPKPPPAILITKPPDPNSKVQTALGFGEMEIRAPWYRPND